MGRFSPENLKKARETYAKKRETLQIKWEEEGKKCVDCGITKPLSEYYIHDSKTGRTNPHCKLCTVKRYSKTPGAGKLLENRELFKIGKKRCTSCLKIKPLSKFYKRKGNDLPKGRCKICSTIYQKDYKLKNNKRYDSYYAWVAAVRFNLPISSITPEITSLIKLEQEVKRSVHIIFDNKKFKTETAVSRYLKSKYNIPIHTSLSRLASGYSIEQCLIPSSEFRSTMNGNSSGKIKVTNVETKEVTVYINKTTCGRDLHICMRRIRKCLDTGETRKPYFNSINKNHLKLEYYE